jgi:four helix bundle protein
VSIDAISGHEGFRRQGDLLNQLQRAGLSISNNIAEGFELGTMDQLISFLYTARGSAGEVRSMFRTMSALPGFAPVHADIGALVAMAENVSRQLGGWLDSMLNSEIEGRRYVSDAVREKADARRRADALMARVREINAQAAESREAQRLKDAEHG